MGMDNTIREKLKKLAEKDYRKFISSLLPDVDNILGIRMPKLRRFAKELMQEDYKSYLENEDLEYMEEVLLQGMLIGAAKIDLGKKLQLMQNYIPKIDNWAVCDSFCGCLKFTENNPGLMWEFIQPYLYSEEEYEIRFGIVMLLIYFVKQEYIDAVLNIMNEIRLEGYYAKMAAAWAISVCYVNFPAQTDEFLKNNSLDDFTHIKAIRKIIESDRIDEAAKEKIKVMVRKRSTKE
jgi:3-methyladenine DNA glycosylase AlkD